MSGIILPNNNNEFKKLENEYEATFQLSYIDFCKFNLVNNPSSEMIEKWVADTITSYQSEVPPEAVLQFFNIPHDKLNIIRNRHYSITVEPSDVINHTEDKVLTIHLHMKLTPTSFLE